MTTFPNELSKFVFTRTYPRWLEDEKRRETIEEAVDRYLAFITKDKLDKLPPTLWLELRKAILNMDVLPSMRALWSAGTSAERCNVALYNCGFVPMDCIPAFSELLYILMQGTGMGYSVEREFVDNLPEVPDSLSKDLVGLITVEDSAEGWCDALKSFMVRLYLGDEPAVDFSKIRPKGARCKTKGGRASGPKPLKDLLAFVAETFYKARGRKLTDIEVSDICCMIGDVTSMGGVRRSALMCFSDPESEAMAHAKDWTRGDFPNYRRKANLSAFYKGRPTRERFDEEWTTLRNAGSGERGFYRIPAHKVLEARSLDLRSNACGEILLRFLRASDPWTGEGGGGQFCNLSSIVVRPGDSVADLLRKAALATWLGALQATHTHFPYLRPAWSELCIQDRLLGVDITGHADNLELCNIRNLSYAASHAEGVAYHAAARLGINIPRAIYTGKPSGNSSQVVDAASGFHARWSPFYIRRVRIAATDPLFALARDSGVPHFPDTKYKGMASEDVVTWVLEFPVKAPEGSLVRADETALQQLERYLAIMQSWCAVSGHNQSATIYVREHEWDEVGDWLYEHFDEVCGLSFLPYAEHKYELAPYSTISEAEYKKRVAEMPTIDYSLLPLYEKDDMGTGAQTLACGSGGCEI